MIAVFRVQDASGRGPWRPGFSKKWVHDRDDHKNLMPVYVEFPDFDLRRAAGMCVGSACRTIEGMRRWVTKEEYSILKKYGFNCVKMDVDVVFAESNVQVFVGRLVHFKHNIHKICLY